jgi:hypothetical protein
MARIGLPLSLGCFPKGTRRPGAYGYIRAPERVRLHSGSRGGELPGGAGAGPALALWLCSRIRAPPPTRVAAGACLARRRRADGPYRPVAGAGGGGTDVGVGDGLAVGVGDGLAVGADVGVLVGVPVLVPWLVRAGLAGAGPMR